MYSEITTIRAQIVTILSNHILLCFEDGTRLRFRSAHLLIQRAQIHIGKQIEATIILTSEYQEIKEFDVINEIAPEQEIFQWREWFSKTCLNWENIDNIEKELNNE